MKKRIKKYHYEFKKVVVLVSIFVLTASLSGCGVLSAIECDTNESVIVNTINTDI